MQRGSEVRWEKTTAEANKQCIINSYFRAEFRKNAGVKDIRVIDMLVIKVKHFYFKRQ